MLQKRLLNLIKTSILKKNLINTRTNTKKRIGSIDLLRGVVMILMALDHTRDYFHGYSHYFDPTDLEHTTLAIFFTRWVTHFCAPVFVLLAGTSAFLKGQKSTKKELSLFLIKRGLWLMLLEITLVSFGWFFNPMFSIQLLQVIWVLGIGMICLAGLIHFPLKAVFSFGVILVVGHNLLDPIRVEGNTILAFLWSSLHAFGLFQFQGYTIVTAYPVVPWIGVMALGYCLGKLYTPVFQSVKRKKVLLWTGFAAILLFLIFRIPNWYGEPVDWAVQSSTSLSIVSFFNLSKYPPSMLFLFMTLGPALLFLAFTEKLKSWATRVISIYGRVPLFYYLIHIYLLHLGAMLAAELTGFGWQEMVFNETWITANPALQGYGFGLWIVYLIWILTVLLLYPLCERYDLYKWNNRQKCWLSYL